MLTLANLFSDHMVLQRRRPLPVWGWAPPGTAVTVTLGEDRAEAVTGSCGRWAVRLPAREAGGPLTLTVTAPGLVQLVRQDILVGEVWLASGQSNMQWSVNALPDKEAVRAAANFPHIRLFKVPNVAETEPVKDVKGTWQLCNGDSVASFSAVGYFFGRELHQRLDLPIGLINASWGGTIAEAWTSREGLLAEPELQSYVKDYEEFLKTRPAKMVEYEKLLATWDTRNIPGDPGDTGSAKGWAAPATDDQGWASMDLPAYWQDRGHKHSGVFWFRRAVTIPAAWASQDLTLSLGALDKSDVTYFNGVKVGSLSLEQRSDSWSVPRVYTVPGSLVKAGKAVVATRIFSNIYSGGFSGSNDQLFLRRAGDERGEQLSLAGTWRYQVEHDFGFVAPPGSRPPPPVGAGNPNSPYILWHTMIEPLKPYALGGAIWYQGESNAGNPKRYATLFPRMIKSWRAAWEQGDFPFIYVQLPNYLAGGSGSRWAYFREAQDAALALPAVARAVTLDVGEARDIHPKDKLSVGDRLARQALVKFYGRQDIVANGPILASATREGASWRLRFTHTAGGLKVKGPELLGFTLAGADKAFKPAQARIEGDCVLVSAAAVPEPVAVRYAWHDDPPVTLFNGAGLPAAACRSDNWPE